MRLQVTVVGGAASAIVFQGTRRPVTGGAEPLSVELPVGAADRRAAGARALTALTFNLASVPDGTYFLRARARGAQGLGPASEETSFAIGSACAVSPPDPPTGLVASVFGVEANLSWNAAVGATSYIVEAGSLPGTSDVGRQAIGNATAFRVTAQPGTYFVRVRAVNACGEGGPSNEVTVRLSAPLGLPGAPGNVQARVVGRSVVITWTPPVTGAPVTGYLVEAGGSPGAADLGVVPVTGTSLVVPQVGPGVYYLRVRATGEAGSGPAGAETQVVVE
ncbi:MAG: hypothetical protein AB7H88_11410 [Vicinamibacterales bacterium]